MIRRAPGKDPDTLPMTSAREALHYLIEGNRRFVSALRSDTTLKPRRHELVEEQRPRAIVLGCSDARVPAEILFDQGVGDLFVVRVAGNVAAPLQVGSVEFAAVQFGVPLVLVLGHSNCGAIQTTLQALEQSSEPRSPNLQAIVDSIRPALEPLVSTESRHDHDALLADAVRANIVAAVNHLRHGSVMLKGLIEEGSLLVVGAEYSLETGVVDFFDGAPADIRP